MKEVYTCSWLKPYHTLGGWGWFVGDWYLETVHCDTSGNSDLIVFIEFPGTFFPIVEYVITKLSHTKRYVWYYIGIPSINCLYNHY